jgi:hypothetical protein
VREVRGRALLLDERQRRLAAAGAVSVGRGGVSKVACASGLSRTTIHRGFAGPFKNAGQEWRPKCSPRKVKISIACFRTSPLNWRGQPLTSHEVIVDLSRHRNAERLEGEGALVGQGKVPNQAQRI